ncbi:hypothetical protein DQM21_07545 [Levilactobacillus brevis]|nr:hypothetical protein DQM21_07545 [Levilactobacillus brevis]
MEIMDYLFFNGVVTIRPLVAANGWERTGRDFKPSNPLVLKLGLILSARKARPKDNDGTDPICLLPVGLRCLEGKRNTWQFLTPMRTQG